MKLTLTRAERQARTATKALIKTLVKCEKCEDPTVLEEELKQAIHFPENIAKEYSISLAQAKEICETIRKSDLISQEINQYDLLEKTYD